MWLHVRLQIGWFVCGRTFVAEFFQSKREILSKIENSLSSLLKSLLVGSEYKCGISIYLHI